MASLQRAGMTWVSTRTKSHHSAILTQGLMSGITANEVALHQLLGFETEALLESHTARVCNAFDKSYTLHSTTCVEMWGYTSISGLFKGGDAISKNAAKWSISLGKVTLQDYKQKLRILRVTTVHFEIYIHWPMRTSERWVQLYHPNHFVAFQLDLKPTRQLKIKKQAGVLEQGQKWSLRECSPPGAGLATLM